MSATHQFGVFTQSCDPGPPTAELESLVFALCQIKLKKAHPCLRVLVPLRSYRIRPFPFRAAAVLPTKCIFFGRGFHDSRARVRIPGVALKRSPHAPRVVPAVVNLPQVESSLSRGFLHWHRSEDSRAHAILARGGSGRNELVFQPRSRASVQRCSRAITSTRGEEGQGDRSQTRGGYRLFL